MKKRIEILEQIIEFYNAKIQMIKDKMRNELNTALKSSFELLKLAEFEETKTEPDFNLKLIRTGNVQTSLDRLGMTEKMLVAILIAFVAKKTFYQEFPFFVIDEITNVMDDTRFKVLSSISRIK